MRLPLLLPPYLSLLAARRVADLFAGLGTLPFPWPGAPRLRPMKAKATWYAALDKAARDDPGLKRLASSDATCSAGRWSPTNWRA